MGWAETEFKTVDIGDMRMDSRLFLLAEKLYESPSSSIPVASSGWSETQGSYRFLAQDNIRWEDVLTPHFECSMNRMAQHDVVLCIQDTTELNFNGRQTKGLGPLSHESQRGMYLHPTYAVSTDREPIGVMDAWMWARKPKDEHGNRNDIKGSIRWIEGYERVVGEGHLCLSFLLPILGRRKRVFNG
ncbi:MAG: transposase [SAR324 cluster bacterium]|nr:transposase [SAR324 cluster bacterium]